jgi:hypothetical protein
MIEQSNPPPSFIYNGTNDLDVDVGVFGEFLSTGKSATQEARKKAKRLAELGLKTLDEDSELGKKLKELDNQIVEVDISLSAFLPLMHGDISLLDFPHESE